MARHSHTPLALTSTMSQDLQTTASPAFAGVSIYDPNFTITLAGTTIPTITFDTDETLIYIRSSNRFLFRTDGFVRASIDPTFLHTAGRLYSSQLTNQLQLNATFVNAPGGSRTHTIPDTSDGEFVMTTGAQTITGAKTFTSVTADTLLLPTAGGTATSLNYYEEYTHTTEVTGPWAGTLTMTIHVTRVGRMMNLYQHGTVQGTWSASAIAQTVTALPARFRCATGLRPMVSTLNNGVATERLTEARTTGQFEFFGSGTNGPFTSGICGIYPWTMSYSVVV